jgi:hypothetical protein
LTLERNVPIPHFIAIKIEKTTRGTSSAGIIVLLDKISLANEDVLGQLLKSCIKR